MKAILFILIFFTSCIYPHELRAPIIPPLYDEWSEGYSETSPEIIMSQLDDWDEPEYIHGGHSTFQINKIDRDYSIGEADGSLAFEYVILSSDLIQYETECYNDSILIEAYLPYKCGDPHCLVMHDSYEYVEYWIHTPATFDGFIQWLKNRKQ